jgi:hypothetical protein
MLSVLDAGQACIEGWKLYRSSAKQEVLRVAGVWSLGTDATRANLDRLKGVLIPRWTLFAEQSVDVREIALASLFEHREAFPEEVRDVLQRVGERWEDLATLAAVYLEWLQSGIPNLPRHSPIEAASTEVVQRYAALRDAYVPDYSVLGQREQRKIDVALFPFRALLPRMVATGASLSLCEYVVTEGTLMVSVYGVRPGLLWTVWQASPPTREVSRCFVSSLSMVKVLQPYFMR